MYRLARLVSIAIFTIILAACGSSSSTSALVKSVSLSVDFSKSAARAIRPPQFFGINSWRTAFDGACTSGATEDGPGSRAGLDCDGDGGAVAYQTPSSYSVAFKGVYLIGADGKKEYLLTFDRLKDIDATGVKDFTASDNSESLSSSVLSSGVTATGIGFEIYYLQLTIKMYGTDKQIRIYLSDDDFANENSRGHHQGDITYFDSSNIEHWANGGSNWFSSPSSTLTRGNFANGVGGIDPETAHARGMFGNEAGWNQTRLQQGSTQDIYFDSVAFTGSGSALTVKFGVADTWFYEDFERTTYTSSFDPCQSGSQEGCGAEWAPLLPSVTSEN